LNFHHGIIAEEQLVDWKAGVGAHTIAEILSEPSTWKSCLNALEQTSELQSLNEKLPRKIEWVFIGCGSSFYLAQAASASWTILTGEKSRALPASEVTLFPQLFPAACQPVLITRSGYTSEVLQAAEYLEERLHLQTLAITCGMDTPISLNAIHSTIKSLADSRAFADYVFLGQGPFFGIAQESMLKVKEMSCSYAQCFHTLEFRHGPKAIVSPETLITFIISETGFAAEVAVLEEIKKLGGTTLVISNAGDSVIRRSADYFVELSLDVPETARVAASVIPGQLLGFCTGIKKGLNPDEPRNLSRVVMLETK
jgi:glucosamine--fructose-6-phosphate aminotransferase (isomerizing)